MQDDERIGHAVALRELVDSVPDGIVVVDRRGTIVFVNDQVGRLFGYAREQLIGENVDILVPRESRGRHGASLDGYFAAPLARPMGKTLGLHGLRRDGTEFPVDISLSPAGVGSETYAIASIRDATERNETMRVLAEARALEVFNRQLKREIGERKLAETAARESEQLLRDLVAQAPVAIAMLDREMRYVMASRRWLADYGLEDRDLRGSSHYDVFPDIPERWREVHRRALNGEVVTAAADRFDRADGTSMWLRWEVRPWFHVAGQGGIIIFTEDITDEQRAFEQIRQLNAQLEQRVQERTAQLEESERCLQARLGEALEEANREISLLQQMSDLLSGTGQIADGIATVARFLPRFFPGSNGAIFERVDASRTLECRAVFGGRTPESSFAADDCVAVGPREPGTPAGGTAGARCRHCAPGGDRTWCLPLAAVGETVFVLHLCVPEPSEQRLLMANAIARTAGLALSGLKLKEALSYQALRDPLTGIHNRRYMDESLVRELHRAARRKRPVSVVLFDLDGFKAFNDSFGHVAGDKYLVAVAAFLKQHFRSEDVLSRYGGEEFLAILPECTAAQARVRAEAIRHGMARVRVMFGGTLLGPLTLSGGIAEFPKDGGTPTVLLQSADKALYRAKESGRNRIVLATPAERARRGTERGGTAQG